MIYIFDQNCSEISSSFQDSDVPAHQQDVSDDDGSSPQGSDADVNVGGRTIRIPLGNLEYSPEELLACQVAIKISSNMTDACFMRQINLVAKGLTDKRHKLPQTRHKVSKELKNLSKIKPTWAVYCPKCLDIISETSEKPSDVTCKGPSCANYSLKGDLAQGKCIFLYLSIKDQIKSYLKNKNFRHVLRKFSKMTWSHMNGKLHKRLLKAGHFDLSLGVDAGQLHQFSNKQILPAVLFFNNLPVSWQLRFPILAAVWTGTSKKEDQPPRNVFLQRMLDELRRLGNSEDIVWKDNSGNRHRSQTFLTTVISDAPEKADLMNHIGPGGYYSCPFCFVQGRTLTKDKFPRPFRKDNFSRKTIGETTIQGVRYPFLINTKKYEWRDSDKRVTMGISAARQRLLVGNEEYNDEGVRGLPAIRFLPGPFKETDSHVPDTLHSICEGVFHDIMKVMVDGTPGAGHTFKKSATSDYGIFDEMMDSMSRVSESDRNCKKLGVFSDWKAYDGFQFLLHDVALLCSNENIIRTTGLYECLLHLSNMTYLSHYGRMTPVIIEEHKAESMEFSTVFLETLTEEYATYKAHVASAHGSDELEIHGCAAYTDGFNLERFISVVKKLCTTNKLQMNQICRNFLLKFHSPILQNMEHFIAAAREILNENGFFSEEFYCKFEDVIKSEHTTQKFPSEEKSALDKFISSDLKMNPRSATLTRVTQMVRKSIILESQHAKHHETSKIRDSYIHLEGGIFGQIAEIAYLKNTGKFLFVLKKYTKITPRASSGASLQYPINQIPYHEPRSDQKPEFHVFQLTDELFVQKAQVSRGNYFHNGRKVQFFSVYPNEWFRY
jgi:hypothetical protein